MDKLPPLEDVRFEMKGKICILRLYRPKNRNALSGRLCIEVEACLIAADNDENVAVVILAADESSDCFCAGADLKGMGSRSNSDSPLLNESLVENRDIVGRMTLAMWHSRKPIIVAIHGHAVGGGITLTLGADIRIAYKGAKVGFVFPRRGLIHEGCSTYFLPRLVGQGRATEWMLTGRTFLAGDEDIRSSGLFNYVVDRPEDALTKALELADLMVTHNSRVCMAYSRTLLWRGLSYENPHQAHLIESRLLNRLYTNPKEPSEGFRCFLEKRLPQFPGSPNDPEAFPTSTYHLFPPPPSVSSIANGSGPLSARL